MRPAQPAQPDHIRGHLDMLALAVLAEQPAHGYAVLEMLKERSAGVLDLPEGSLYPALHRLEAAGLLASEWDTSTGRKRRVYKVTKRGRSVLSAEQTEWHRFANAVQAVLRGGAPWPSTV
ncbi:MAG: PadR family transcriptional regulator [Acidimicrobiia bacterium]